MRISFCRGCMRSNTNKQIGSAIFGLLRHPEPHDSVQLKGAFHGERRLDVGEYRIVQAVVGDTVQILVIGKRNDGEVYKAWQRMK